MRAVPSQHYVLNRTPIWNKHYVASTEERILEGDEPPAGGFGWDGRFDSLLQQAALPQLSPNEMPNAGPADVTAKLRPAPYAGQFRRVFGERIFDDTQQVFAKVLIAIERLELEDSSLRAHSAASSTITSMAKQRSTSRRSMAWRCSRIRKAATAPPAISTGKECTVRTRCSPTSSSKPWACRAIRSFAPIQCPATSMRV